MIHGAVEFAAGVFDTYFVSDMQTLAAGDMNIDTRLAGIEKRRPAEMFLALGKPLPRMGIWPESCVTQARSEKRRRSIVRLVADYMVENADDQKAAETAEWAAEAIMLSIDRMAESATYDVVGSAMQEGSASIVLALASSVSTRAPQYRVMVRFDVDVWDT